MPAGRHRKTTRWTLRRLAAAAGVAVTVALASPIAALTHVMSADEPVVRTALRAVPKAAGADLRASRSSDRLMMPAPRSRPPMRETQPAVQLSPRWTMTRLNVWTRPGEDSRLLTVLDTAVKVSVTGTVDGAWAEVEEGDRMAWVRKEYLASKKPSPTAGAAGVSGVSCPDGSSVESGLQANTVKLYRSVCAAFPEVGSWGGRSGSGDHGAGRALDIMCSGSLGDAIADYVRSHASAFGVSEIIWSQRIWTSQRGSEGWRAMDDRGSGTANHYDHVHVSVS